MSPVWVTLCRRTKDPKLAYLESSLTDMQIPHRRNGESFHAPILEVPHDRHAEAEAFLDSAFNDIYARVDDVPDNHPIFKGHFPHDWIPESS
jgi:hypothetical protein